MLKCKYSSRMLFDWSCTRVHWKKGKTWTFSRSEQREYVMDFLHWCQTAQRVEAECRKLGFPSTDAINILSVYVMGVVLNHSFLCACLFVLSTTTCNFTRHRNLWSNAFWFQTRWLVVVAKQLWRCSCTQGTSSSSSSLSWCWCVCAMITNLCVGNVSRFSMSVSEFVGNVCLQGQARLFTLTTVTKTHALNSHTSRHLHTHTKLAIDTRIKCFFFLGMLIVEIRSFCLLRKQNITLEMAILCSQIARESYHLNRFDTCSILQAFAPCKRYTSFVCLLQIQ